MNRRPTRTSERKVWRLLAWLGTLSSVACAREPSSDSCGTAPETFVAYAPGALVSDIPLCNASDSGAPPIDGASFGALPGSSPLSSAGVAECETICTTSVSVVPCCVSMWEPNTVLCPPQCVAQ
jgi:hypothetical protein